MGLPLRTALESPQQWDSFRGWLLSLYDYTGTIRPATEVATQLARDWASKTSGPVKDGLYSARWYRDATVAALNTQVAMWCGVGPALPLTRPGGLPLQPADLFYLQGGAQSHVYVFSAGSWVPIGGLDMVALSGANGSASVGYGPRNVAFKLSDLVSVRDEGAVLDGVTDDSAALIAANAKAAGRPILIDGVMHLGTAVTVTSPLVDVDRQIFTLTSQVTIDNGQPIRPEWFGTGQNAFFAAYLALPARGGDIVLLARRYAPSGFAYGDIPKYLNKRVRVLGCGVPSWGTNMESLTDGSVIEGPVFAYADNIEFRDLGVDSGKGVCDTYFGGAPQEGLLATYPSQAFKDANTQRRGLRMHNVRTLCHSPGALVHGIIAGEGMTGIRLTGVVETACSFHGIVFKGSHVQADAVKAFQNNGEGVIIKTDVQTTSRSNEISINQIFTTKSPPEGMTAHTASTGAGVGTVLNPHAGDVGSIYIGSIKDTGNSQAFGLQYGNNDPATPDKPRTVDNVQIGSITGDMNTYSTVNLGVAPGCKLFRVQIGQVIARNSPVGVLSNAGDPQIDALHAVNCGVAADISEASALGITTTKADALSVAVFRIGGSARPSLGRVTRSSAAIPMFTSSAGLFGSGTVPTFINGWEQFPGNDVFGITLDGDWVHFTGLVRPSASTPGSAQPKAVLQMPFWAIPLRPRRGRQPCRSPAGGESDISVVMGNDGILRIGEITGNYGDCENWLSLSGFSYKLSE